MLTLSSSESALTSWIWISIRWFCELQHSAERLQNFWVWAMNLSQMLLRLWGRNGWVVKYDRAWRSSDLRSRNDTDLVRISFSCQSQSCSLRAGAPIGFRAEVLPQQHTCPLFFLTFSSCYFNQVTWSIGISISWLLSTLKIVVFDGGSKQKIFYRSSSLLPSSYP